MPDGRLIVICLKPGKEDNGKRCQKAISAYSRDPEIPSTFDELFVGINMSSKTKSQTKYRITRAALLKGAAPTEIYRNWKLVCKERVGVSSAIYIEGGRSIEIR